HAGEQNLARTALHPFPRPFDRIASRVDSPAVNEYVPGELSVRRGGALGVNREDDALSAERFRAFAEQFGIFDRGRVDRNFVGAGAQKHANVFDGANAAADGQRAEALFGGAADDVDDGAAAFVAGGDVEKTELIGALGVVARGDFNRIAGIAQAFEV